MPLIGNTARFTAQFRSWPPESKPVDIDNWQTTGKATLTIYDGAKQVVKTVVLGADDRVGVGLYAYDYVLPGEPTGQMSAEVKGIVEGSVALGRTQIERTWT